jgi:peptidoglycan/LPS O-acetylase OafA/YrhL
MKIKFDPNPQGWLAIFIILFMCVAQQSLMPLLVAVVILVVLFPLCIWLHHANERAAAKMLAEFPDDPIIQKKYGRYRNNTGRTP